MTETVSSVPADPYAHRDQRSVHLDVPCVSGSLALLRLAMVTVLSEAGATMTELDSGRFAVSELCSLAVDAAGSGGRLSVTIRPEPHCVRLDGESSCGCKQVAPSGFVTALLDEMMVEWSASTDDRCRFHAVVPVTRAGRARGGPFGG